MENATGDRKSSESEKHFIAGLNGRALGFLTNAVGEKKKKKALQVITTPPRSSSDWPQPHSDPRGMEVGKKHRMVGVSH